MINCLSKKIADFLAFKAGYSPEEERYQSMLFFIKAVLHNVIKTVFLLAAAFLVSLKLSADYLAYMLFLMCIYGMIKRFSFGVHSSNEVLCTLAGLIYYLGGTFLALSVRIPFVAVIITIVACFILNCRYAPSPTQKRKIGGKESRRLKGYVQFVYMDVLLLAFVFKITAQPELLNLIVLAVAWQTITILPITYRLLGERRD